MGFIFYYVFWFIQVFSVCPTMGLDDIIIQYLPPISDYLMPVLVSAASVIWVLAFILAALWCVKRRCKRDSDSMGNGYAPAMPATPEDNNTANNTREQLNQIRNHLEKNTVSGKIGEDEDDAERRLLKGWRPAERAGLDAAPGKCAHWTSKRDNRELENKNSLHRMEYIV